MLSFVKGEGVRRSRFLYRVLRLDDVDIGTKRRRLESGV